MTADETKSSAALTDLLRKTGVQKVEDLPFMATKTFLGLGRLGINKVYREGVPARLKGFETRVFNGKKVQCTVVEYHDGRTFALPTDSMYKGFRFIPRENITTTYIEIARLKKGL
jgi:hypothetical protein